MNFLLLVLWTQLLPAQSPAGQLPTDELISRLYEYVREYRASLPSFSCDEAITSKIVKKGEVKREMKIIGTLRVLRHNSGPEEFPETHNFRTIDGHPPQQHFFIPYWVEGGLANGHGFALPAIRDCFVYNVVPEDRGRVLRVSVKLRENMTDPKCNDVGEGYRRIALFDTVVGQVTHIEVALSPEAAKKFKRAYFATMDYAPQALGDKTIWLPVRLVAHDETGEREMTADYSNYHRYTAKVEILPASNEDRQ